jgi:hypothetical protein
MGLYYDSFKSLGTQSFSEVMKTNEIVTLFELELPP